MSTAIREAEQAAAARAREGDTAWNLLNEIRAAGWMVAAHNDYCQDGAFYTFWLFTKDGYCIKGEGHHDQSALKQVAAAIRARSRSGSQG